MGKGEPVPHCPATPAAAGAKARQMLGCPLSRPRAMNVFSPMHTSCWGDSDVTSMSGLHQTTLWLLKPGRPSPPRGTALQPGVLCKAQSPCHHVEPMAMSQGCLRGRREGAWVLDLRSWRDGEGGRWSDGCWRDGEQLEIARTAPGDRSGPTKGRGLGRRMSQVRP